MLFSPAEVDIESQWNQTNSHKLEDLDLYHNVLLIQAGFVLLINYFFFFFKLLFKVTCH